MPELVATITHVPGTREQLLADVRAGIEGIPHEVVTDPHREGVWPTTRRAWDRVLALAAERGASHGIVLQDDMVPVPGFCQGALAALAANPEAIVGFFCVRPALVRLAQEAGSSWAVAEDGAWGGTVAMPIAVAAAFVAWADRWIPHTYPHDDRRITAYVVATGRTVWLTMPSLIEHRAPKASLLGHSGGRYRTAAWLAEDARLVDWSRGLDRPVRRPVRLSRDVLGLLARCETATTASW